MKAKKSKPASLRYIGELFKSTWAHTKERYGFYGAFVVVAILAAVFMMPHDREWLNIIRKDPQLFPGIHDVAGAISHYTMYQFTPLLLCVVIWLAGWIKKSSHLKRIALVCFVAGTASGIFVNFLRPGFGRPRPRANLEDKFHYFEVKSDMLSFPSGHVLSNTAGAAALTIVEPWIGVPYLVLSSGTAWSRMQRNAHYPADVTFAAIIGLGMGLAFGNGAKRLLKKHEDPLDKE